MDDGPPDADLPAGKRVKVTAKPPLESGEWPKSLTMSVYHSFPCVFAAPIAAVSSFKENDTKEGDSDHETSPEGVLNANKRPVDDGPSDGDLPARKRVKVTGEPPLESSE